MREEALGVEDHAQAVGVGDGAQVDPEVVLRLQHTGDTGQRWPVVRLQRTRR